jgi:phosphatidylglycerol phospholipase C
MGFNMLQNNMVGPFSSAFSRSLREAKRSIFFWTVNDERWMKWSILKEVDGVITDDPKKFLKVCDGSDGEEIHLPFKAWRFVIWLNIKCVFYSIIYWYRYGFKIDYAKVSRV